MKKSYRYFLKDGSEIPSVDAKKYIDVIKVAVANDVKITDKGRQVVRDICKKIYEK